MEDEILINVYETGITPEDALKKSYNGMALRKEYETIPWKEDVDIYNPAELTKIEIINEDPKIQVGGTQRLYVKQTPEIANLPELCWESSNLEVAWVNQEGIVYGLSEGETVITVSKPASDFSDTVTVEIVNGGRNPETINLINAPSRLANNSYCLVHGTSLIYESEVSDPGAGDSYKVYAVPNADAATIVGMTMTQAVASGKLRSYILAKSYVLNEICPEANCDGVEIYTDVSDGVLTLS